MYTPTEEAKILHRTTSLVPGKAIGGEMKVGETVLPECSQEEYKMLYETGKFDHLIQLSKKKAKKAKEEPKEGSEIDENNE